MITPSVFLDKNFIAATKKLYVTMEVTAHRAGDISFGEYALLVNCAEFESGLPLNWILSSPDDQEDALCSVRMLEEKELLQRARMSTDRRSFTLMVTPKGRTRLALTDQAIAAAFISLYEKWTEEEFEYLINKMQALPTAYVIHSAKDSATTARIGTIFPGAFLSFVHKHRRSMVKIAAYYGLTTLQTNILYAFKDTNMTLPLNYFTRFSDLPSVVLEFQMNDLAKRDLLAIGHLLELTEKGSLRVEDMTRKIALHMDSFFADYLEEDAVLFEELGEYCVYLFS